MLTLKNQQCKWCVCENDFFFKKKTDDPSFPTVSGCIDFCSFLQNNAISFESKIRTGVMENTMPQMADLFTVFKRACYKQLGYFDQFEEETEREGLIKKESIEDSQNVEPAKAQNFGTSITNILLLLIIPFVLLIIWKHWQQRSDQQHILLSQVKDVKETFEDLLHDIEKLKSEVENALQSVNKILIDTNQEQS
jgi:large-conductance mechanosensitive channel